VLRRRIENPLATELLEEHFRGARGVRVEPGDPLRFVPYPAPVPPPPAEAGEGIR
jgi:hypothetical protein